MTDLVYWLFDGSPRGLFVRNVMTVIFFFVGLFFLDTPYPFFALIFFASAAFFFIGRLLLFAMSLVRTRREGG